MQNILHEEHAALEMNVAASLTLFFPPTAPRPGFMLLIPARLPGLDTGCSILLFASHIDRFQETTIVVEALSHFTESEIPEDWSTESLL